MEILKFKRKTRNNDETNINQTILRTSIIHALDLSSGASIILVACASFVLVGLNIMGSFVRSV